MLHQRVLKTHYSVEDFRQVGKSLLVIAFVFLFFTLTMSAEANGQNGDHEYSGQAEVVDIKVLFKRVNLIKAGPLPLAGGAYHNSLLEKSVLGLLNARVLHAATVGHGNMTHSEASVANIGVTASGISITADFLMAEANASCESGQAAFSGRSSIANLVVNGHPINVSGQPNQTINLAGVRIVINEQSQNGDEISVTALHVSALGLAEVKLSSAEAGIDCYEAPPPDQEGDDFVTGGGFVTGTPSGEKANFAIGGGIRNGDFWGHLTYIDQAANLKVKDLSITGYEVVNETTRRISGTARINNQSGYTFTVTVSDNGEPGTADTFFITLSNGYSAGGVLDGGNIQLHTH